MGIIIGTIGTIVAAAVTVAKAISLVGLTIQGLKALCNAISSIAKALGIIKEDKDVEEIGDRALQAEEQGITPDKYASYEEWVKRIEKDDWGYDPEKTKKVPVEQKILKGVEVSAAVTIERFPNVPIQDFFALAGNHPEFFSVERMGEVGKLANTDPKKFESVVNYITGTDKGHATIETALESLMDIEMAIDSELSEDMAYDKAASYRELS